MVEFVSVALAGTPEALTADFVCDGFEDEVEINAAIEQAGALGGGIVSIAAGIYSTSGPIVIHQDNVSVVGSLGHDTVIRPAIDWVSSVLSTGAELTGVVSFVGVNNFAAVNLVVESPTLPMNGIIAIPDGAVGTGTISTNGVFDNNIVRMAQAHTYSIWSLKSSGMTITNNLVDGGGTFANSHISQEGIEIFGGDGVLISGNTIQNMGNAAINLVTIAAVVPDSSISNVQVFNNNIDSSRIGVFLGSTYSPENGPANLTKIEISGNVITNGFEGGVILEIQDGVATDPTIFDNISITDNQIELIANPSTGFIPTAIYLDGKNGTDLHLINDISISNNLLTLTETSLTPPSPSRIQADNSRFAIFYNVENVAFEDNILTSNVQNSTTNAVSAILADGVSISRNDISGFMGFGIENSSSDNMIIDGNRILDWGGWVDYFAILVANSDNVVVSSNDVESPADYSGAIGSNSASSNVHFIANRMIADRDFSIAGTQYSDLLLTNGTNAVGNSLANYIRGNASSNRIDGGGGADTLQGLGGNDTYYVDDAGDIIIEAASGGTRDVVYSSVNYTLDAGARVEVMSSLLNAASTPQNLTGNSFVQDIVGNAGANVLDGGGGRDSLQGLGGDDIYIVRQGNEIIYESINAGTDEVRSMVNFTLATSTHVEKLSTTDALGVTALNLTGNGFVQEIVGNAGDNVLDGAGGADTLQGLGGDDVFRFSGLSFGNDTIVDYESGIDKISFSLVAADSFDDLVIANNGTNLVTVSISNQNIFVASSTAFTIDSNDFLFV